MDDHAPTWEDLEETWKTAKDPVLTFLQTCNSQEMKILKEKLLGGLSNHEKAV